MGDSWWVGVDRQGSYRNVSDSTDAGTERKIRLSSFGLTDGGLKRPHNEDSIAVREDLQLFIVADGMGGHAAGEVASQTSVAVLTDFIDHALRDRDFTWPFGMKESYSYPENILMSGIQMANRQVCLLADQNVQYTGMGTTLALLFIFESGLHIAHVGDSRVYRLRQGKFEQLTADHSWVNEQLQRNIITETEARNHRWRNVITRALGHRHELEVDLRKLDALPGDCYLLCTDGLTGMLGDDTIRQQLLAHAGDPEGACQALVAGANQSGGIDNISVIVVNVAAG